MQYYFGDQRQFRFGAARRLEVLGGPVTWILDGGEPANVAAFLSLGLDLGKIVDEHGNALSTGEVRLHAMKVESNRLVVEANETILSQSALKPQRKVHSDVKSLTGWLRDVLCVVKNFARSQAVLDTFTSGGSPIPCIIQNGISSFDLAAWLTWHITFRESSNQTPLVMKGTDGPRWEIVSLTLARVLSPDDDFANLWRIVSVEPPPIGPLAIMDQRNASSVKLERQQDYDAGRWSDLKAERSCPFLIADPLPLPLAEVGLAIPNETSPRIVVAVEDQFDQAGIHTERHWAIEASVPIWPQLPATIRNQQTVFEGRTGTYENKAWTVPCTLDGFSGSVNACLSTFDAGEQGTSGLHIVPTAGSRVVLFHSGSLVNHSKVLVSTRLPTLSNEKEQMDDVRSMGSHVWAASKGLCLKCSEDAGTIQIESGVIALTSGPSVLTIDKDKLDIACDSRGLQVSKEHVDVR